MKTIILIAGILVCMTAAHFVFGQTEGTITYLTKVNVHRTIPSDRAELKQMIPEYNSYRSRLAFRNSESLYAPIEEDDEEDFGDDGPVIRRPQYDFYFDHANKKFIIAREFFGKSFLIEDSTRLRPWKFTSEKKDILGWSCAKATWRNPERGQNVVVWYAEALLPSLGPEDFTGLPGTVLEVNINDGERVITVEKLDNLKLKRGDLVIPSRGQKIKESEFKEMMEGHLKKVSGQGSVIIRN